MDEGIEYLEEYEDLVLPNLSSSSSSKTTIPTTQSRSLPLKPLTLDSDNDSSSSSYDQDIFESLFDNVSDVDDDLMKKDSSKRESLDSIDALVKDLGERVAKNASLKATQNCESFGDGKTNETTQSFLTKPTTATSSNQRTKPKPPTATKSPFLHRPVPTIVRPEKIITKDPAEDPLKLDDILDTNTSMKPIDYEALSLSEVSNDSSQSSLERLSRTVATEEHLEPDSFKSLSPKAKSSSSFSYHTHATAAKSQHLPEKVKILSNTPLHPVDKELIKSISRKETDKQIVPAEDSLDNRLNELNVNDDLIGHFLDGNDYDNVMYNEVEVETQEYETSSNKINDDLEELRKTLEKDEDASSAEDPNVESTQQALQEDDTQLSSQNIIDAIDKLLSPLSGVGNTDLESTVAILPDASREQRHELELGDVDITSPTKDCKRQQSESPKVRLFRLPVSSSSELGGKKDDTKDTEPPTTPKKRSSIDRSDRRDSLSSAKSNTPQRPTASSSSAIRKSSSTSSIASDRARNSRDSSVGSSVGSAEKAGVTTPKKSKTNVKSSDRSSISSSDSSSAKIVGEVKRQHSSESIKSSVKTGTGISGEGAANSKLLPQNSTKPNDKNNQSKSLIEDKSLKQQKISSKIDSSELKEVQPKKSKDASNSDKDSKERPKTDERKAEESNKKGKVEKSSSEPAKKTGDKNLPSKSSTLERTVSKESLSKTPKNESSKSKEHSKESDAKKDKESTKNSSTYNTKPAGSALEKETTKDAKSQKGKPSGSALDKESSKSQNSKISADNASRPVVDSKAKISNKDKEIPRDAKSQNTKSQDLRQHDKTNQNRSSSSHEMLKDTGKHKSKESTTEQTKSKQQDGSLKRANSNLNSSINTKTQPAIEKKSSSNVNLTTITSKDSRPSLPLKNDDKHDAKKSEEKRDTSKTRERKLSTGSLKSQHATSKKEPSLSTSLNSSSSSVSSSGSAQSQKEKNVLDKPKSLKTNTPSKDTPAASADLKKSESKTTTTAAEDKKSNTQSKKPAANEERAEKTLATMAAPANANVQKLKSSATVQRRNSFASKQAATTPQKSSSNTVKPVKTETKSASTKQQTGNATTPSSEKSPKVASSTASNVRKAEAEKKDEKNSPDQAKTEIVKSKTTSTQSNAGVGSKPVAAPSTDKANKQSTASTTPQSANQAAATKLQKTTHQAAVSVKEEKSSAKTEATTTKQSSSPSSKKSDEKETITPAVTVKASDNSKETTERQSKTATTLPKNSSTLKSQETTPSEAKNTNANSLKTQKSATELKQENSDVTSKSSLENEQIVTPTQSVKKLTLMKESETLKNVAEKLSSKELANKSADSEKPSEQSTTENPELEQNLENIETNESPHQPRNSWRRGRKGKRKRMGGRWSIKTDTTNNASDSTEAANEAANETEAERTEQMKSVDDEKKSIEKLAEKGQVQESQAANQQSTPATLARTFRKRIGKDEITDEEPLTPFKEPEKPQTTTRGRDLTPSDKSRSRDPTPTEQTPKTRSRDPTPTETPKTRSRDPTPVEKLTTPSTRSRVPTPIAANVGLPAVRRRSKTKPQSKLLNESTKQLNELKNTKSDEVKTEANTDDKSTVPKTSDTTIAETKTGAESMSSKSNSAEIKDAESANADAQSVTKNAEDMAKTANVKPLADSSAESASAAEATVGADGVVPEKVKSVDESNALSKPPRTKEKSSEACKEKLVKTSTTEQSAKTQFEANADAAKNPDSTETTLTKNVNKSKNDTTPALTTVAPKSAMKSEHQTKDSSKSSSVAGGKRGNRLSIEAEDSSGNAKKPKLDKDEGNEKVLQPDKHEFKEQAMTEAAVAETKSPSKLNRATTAAAEDESNEPLAKKPKLDVSIKNIANSAITLQLSMPNSYDSNAISPISNDNISRDGVAPGSASSSQLSPATIHKTKLKSEIERLMDAMPKELKDKGIVELINDARPKMRTTKLTARASLTPTPPNITVAVAAVESKCPKTPETITRRTARARVIQTKTDEVFKTPTRTAAQSKQRTSDPAAKSHGRASASPKKPLKLFNCRPCCVRINRRIFKKLAVQHRLLDPTILKSMTKVKDNKQTDISNFFKKAPKKESGTTISTANAKQNRSTVGTIAGATTFNQAHEHSNFKDRANAGIFHSHFGDDDSMEDELSLLTPLRSKPVIEDPPVPVRQLPKNKRRSTNSTLPLNTATTTKPTAAANDHSQKSAAATITMPPSNQAKLIATKATSTKLPAVDPVSTLVPLLPPKIEVDDYEEDENSTATAILPLAPATTTYSNLKNNPTISTKPTLATTKPQPKFDKSSGNSTLSSASTTGGNANATVSLVNNSISSSVYNFLYPSKYHPSYGEVLLDCCCRDLQGPIPAVNPQRLHSVLEANIQELPAYVVMTTQLVTQEELKSKKNYIPASVRQKLERSPSQQQQKQAQQQQQQLPPNHQAQTIFPVSQPQTQSQPQPPLPTLPTLPTLANKKTTTGATVPTTLPLMPSTISALKKQLPSTTTITAKTGNPNTNQDPEELVRRVDSMLLKLSHLVLTASFSDRQLVIEAISKQNKYTAKDIDLVAQMLQDYEQCLISKMAKRLPTAQAAPAAATTTSVGQPPVGKLPTLPTLPKQPTAQPTNTQTPLPSTPYQHHLKQNVPVYDANKTIIGYQMQIPAKIAAASAAAVPTSAQNQYNTAAQAASSKMTSSSSNNSAAAKPYGGTTAYVAKLPYTASQSAAASVAASSTVATTLPTLPTKRPAQESPRVFYTKIPPSQASTPINTTPSATGDSASTPDSAGTGIVSKKRVRFSTHLPTSKSTTTPTTSSSSSSSSSPADGNAKQNTSFNPNLNSSTASEKVMRNTNLTIRKVPLATTPQQHKAKMPASTSTSSAAGSQKTLPQRLPVKPQQRRLLNTLAADNINNYSNNTNKNINSSNTTSNQSYTVRRSLPTRSDDLRQQLLVATLSTMTSGTKTTATLTTTTTTSAKEHNITSHRPSGGNSSTSSTTTMRRTTRSLPSETRQIMIVSKDSNGKPLVNYEDECILPDEPDQNMIKRERQDDDFIGAN